MFEVLWRLSSYRRTWVPIVASLLSAAAWQQFATILIKYDKVPQDHYPRLVCMCLLFGAWALLDDDRDYLEQEWQKHIEKLGISEPWQPVCIEDVTDNISAARHIALVEAYARVSLHFVSRDIRDLLCQDPTRTNVEIAQQALNGCLDVGSNYRFDAFVDLETAMALVCRARQMVEKKYKLHLVAELTAIY